MSKASGRGRSDALSTALKKRAEEEGETATRRERSSHVLAREGKWLIVGAPGEGKSTLLKHNLLEATGRWRERPTEHPFLIFVRLADWEAEGGASDGRLFRFLANRLPAMGEIGSKAVEQWLRGPVLWLLDGIDEIRDAGERVRLVEEVKATSAVRIHDRWVVSTRPAGEPRGGLVAGWTRAVLPNLSDAQVEGVLARWGSVLKTKEGLPLDAPQVARDLRRDAGLRQVRTNALLLTLAILFFKTRKRPPHDRWEFYEAAEMALRDSWVNYRIRSAERYLPGNYLPELLERLALAGMENGQVLFERDLLKQEARRLLAERGYTGGEQSEEIGRFLRAAEDLIGVLVEQGPDRFGFLHLTFQEFYAARAIVHRSGEATRLIARYWDHPDWREVWPLYALAVQNDPVRYAELFETILAHAHPLDRRLFRPQLACLRLAGLGTIPHPTQVAAVLDWAGTVLAGGVEPLLDVLRVLAGWERALTEAIRLKVLTRLDGENWHVRQAAVEALAGAGADATVRAALLARLTDDEESVIHAALKALAGAPSEENVRAHMLAGLGGDDEDARRTAVRALSGAVSEKHVRMGLLARLNDAAFVVRREAVRALESALGEPEVRSAVVARLADDDGGVRAASAQVLTGAVGEVDVRGALLAKLADDDGRVRAAVVQALAGGVAEANVRQK